MLTVRYPAAWGLNRNRCVIYLAPHDVATLRAGHALETGLSGATLDALPIVLVCGEPGDAETKRALAVGEGGERSSRR